MSNERPPPLLRPGAFEAFDSLGFEEGIVLLIHTGRRLLESSPEVYGKLLMKGVMYEATIQAAGRRAEFERKGLQWDYHELPEKRVSIIPATIFTTIAYGHAYYDGNKRTGFLTATATARALGFAWREPLPEWDVLLEDVRAFVEGNESEDPARKAASGSKHVARWMLEKVLTVPPQTRERKETSR